MTLSLRDILQDVVKHAAFDKLIEFIRITPENNELLIEALSGSELVIFGSIKSGETDIDEQVALRDLDFLKALLNLSNYKESSEIEVKRSREGIDKLVFSDDDNNTDQYRFMSIELLANLVPQLAADNRIKFKGIRDALIITPSKQMAATVAGLISVYGANAPLFTLEIEDGDLFIEVSGQQNNFMGKRLLTKNVKGNVTKGYRWSLGMFSSILNLSVTGNSEIHIGDNGAIMFKVNSGIGEYNIITVAKSNTE